MPAENDSPAPLTTTARTSSGRLSPMSARACQSRGVWLFRLSGLFSVTVSTASVCETCRPAAARVSSSGRLMPEA